MNFLKLEEMTTEQKLGMLYTAYWNPWKNVEEKHKKLHGYGNHVIQALMNNDYSEAKKQCNDALEFSKVLIADLEEMKEIALSKKS